MFCDRCGTNLGGGVPFCPSCGKQFGPAPTLSAAPLVNRVAGNLRTLAILWMVYSAVRIAPGLFLNSLDGYPFMNHAPFMVHGVLRTVGGTFILTGVIGLIAGWGLMERKSWARMLAIVLGFISLVHFPFGTAIGAYTLWVLLPATSEQEYQRMAR